MIQRNYSSTKLPTVGASSAIGGASAWSNPSRITADDSSSASWAAFGGGQQSAITGSVFGFPALPPNAVIDGIQVYVDGAQFSAFGTISLNISGSVGKDIGGLNISYGGPTDKWGKTVITAAEIAALTVTANVGDVSGGDATASIDYLSATVFWHIDAINTFDSDVPTRVDYKVFSSDGSFLGLLPDVTSKLGFSQDINAAGSTINIVCGKFINNEVTVDPILDNTSAPILTESNLPILARSSELLVARGNSEDEVLFKNGNRVAAFLYNQWYPNGKLMFSGQINKVSFQFGGGNSSVNLLVYSDGLDLDNFITRGYPFTYTDDVVQTTANTTTLIEVAGGGKGGGWHVFGQTWKVGAGVTNLGALVVALRGTADVTVYVYDGPNGNLLGSVTKAISLGAITATQFEFASLIPVTPGNTYFFAIWVAPGQSIELYYASSNVYGDGTMYDSSYAGGSGGGSFVAVPYDIYFATKSGVPTTTTTYSTQDPVTGMARSILADYNNRGGLIKERTFTATGLSLTYLFNSATIFDAVKKIIEMSPSGYHSYIDLGTAQMDIKPTSVTPDFTIVRGKDINQLTIAMSIEQVKNYLLLSGGEVTPGVNLFRQYTDNDSVGRYGVRLAQKSDNRITQTATADAIGNSFKAENAGETQETSETVLNELIDITLLTPGKTIGFKNFGGFIDSMVLQIVRREYQPHAVNLTLGRLPVTMNAEIQRLSRELVFEQTISNPSAPS